MAEAVLGSLTLALALAVSDPDPVVADAGLLLGSGSIRCRIRPGSISGAQRGDGHQPEGRGGAGCEAHARCQRQGQEARVPVLPGGLSKRHPGHMGAGQPTG